EPEGQTAVSFTVRITHHALLNAMNATAPVPARTSRAPSDDAPRVTYSVSDDARTLGRGLTAAQAQEIVRATVNPHLLTVTAWSVEEPDEILGQINGEEFGDDPDSIFAAY